MRIRGYAAIAKYCRLKSDVTTFLEWLRYCDFPPVTKIEPYSTLEDLEIETDELDKWFARHPEFDQFIGQDYLVPVAHTHRKIADVARVVKGMSYRSVRGLSRDYFWIDCGCELSELRDPPTSKGA